MADHDPSTPPNADSPRVPGLLDQYRQQRRAWLEQADALARMREEVRSAAEREAIEIVTAARRDVRRIIVEARRELLVLTAQLHAAVEATDAPELGGAPFTGLLADPEARSRVETASHDTGITSDVVYEARKGVRSVLDEARAEIEALSSEAPAIFGHGSPQDVAPHADERETAPEAPADDDSEAPVNEGPIHELSLDASLAALEFQTRDLPIPTLARLLGSDSAADAALGSSDRAAMPSAFDPLVSYDTPRLSELRSLLRDSIEPGDSVRSPDVAPLAATPFTFDTSPKPDFFGERESAHAQASETHDDERDAIEPETQQFTPPSRLFAEDDGRSPGRSARAFVALFAATGALALIATLWWALSRDSAPRSAAAPVITEKSAGPSPATTATPAVANNAPGTLALTIEARRPSWIRAQIDGKEDAGRIYQAGETRHIYGARTVSIRAGDAGAVFVGVDGGTARALGADGTAATKQFSAAVIPAVATADGRAPSVTNAAATAPLPAAARTPLAQTTAATPRVPAAPASTPQQPPAAASRGASPSPAVAPAAPREGIGGGRPDLVEGAKQWLDAYQRRDRDAMGAMATENVTVSDERSVTERFPAWQGGVQRDLDEVALELTGDVAVFTARMTERADAPGGQHVSRVSQFWQRRSGRWYVTNVRIIGEARLNQIIR